jgi:two-component sensor histidine kinase
MKKTHRDVFDHNNFYSSKNINEASMQMIGQTMQSEQETNVAQSDVRREANVIEKSFRRKKSANPEKNLENINNMLLTENSQSRLKQELKQRGAFFFGESFEAKVINSLNAHIAILDGQGQIVAVNASWERFAKLNDARGNFSVGANYLSVCDSVEPGECSDDAKRMASGIRSVIFGEKDSFELEYPCHAPNEQRWFCAKVNPINHEGKPYIVVSHENVSFQKKAAEKVQRSIVETHHRVKNNLQLIATLVELNRADTDDPSIHDLLKRIRVHLISMASIHDLLTSESKEMRSGVEDYKISSSDLLRKVVTSLLELSPRHIILADLEYIKLPAKTLGSIAVITNELLLNALKYSHNEVQFKFYTEKDFIQVVIEDNGKGFFEGFEMSNDANTGLQVVSSIAEYELGGKLFISRSEILGGAKVMVTIPYQRI